MAKIYFETYGCSNNQAETQMMEGILERDGHTITMSLADSDVVVINTCSVKSKTEQKTLHAIDSLQTHYPDKKFVIGGCMPSATYERIKSYAPHASLLNTHNITKIGDIVTSTLAGTPVEFLSQEKIEKVGIPKRQSNPVLSIVPISNGCMSSCSFCSTKRAKGALHSYDMQAIVSDIAQSHDAGATEFWLTSQDCGCYGFERNEHLALLLDRITSSVRGRHFLRVGMASPQHIKRILPELISSYQNPHVYKFLHIPVQSGSDRILRVMRRGHSSHDFIAVVDAFRSAIPDITIWTDMIVGFPCETDADFLASMDLLSRARPDFVNISAYSSRPHTASSAMKQIPTDVKKGRTRRMTTHVRAICLEQNQRWIGWSGSVFINEYNVSKHNWIGRTPFYKPVVLSCDVSLGDVVMATITGATETYLVGELFAGPRN